jgi:hypothetical protein
MNLFTRAVFLSICLVSFNLVSFDRGLLDDEVDASWADLDRGSIARSVPYEYRIEQARAYNLLSDRGLDLSSAAAAVEGSLHEVQDLLILASDQGLDQYSNTQDMQDALLIEISRVRMGVLEGYKNQYASLIRSQPAASIEQAIYDIEQKYMYQDLNELLASKPKSGGYLSSLIHAPEVKPSFLAGLVLGNNPALKLDKKEILPIEKPVLLWAENSYESLINQIIHGDLASKQQLIATLDHNHDWQNLAIVEYLATNLGVPYQDLIHQTLEQKESEIRKRLFL